MRASTLPGVGDITTRGVLTRQIERRAYPVRLARAAGAPLGGIVRLTGTASVVDNPYPMWDWFGEYSEVVRAGAFTRTLNANPAVQLLLNHGGLSMAYTRAGTLALVESPDLDMTADVNTDRTDVRDMVIALDDGAVDEMSFAFRVTRQLWSPDWLQRDILEVDIHKGDVSVVNFGANPDTSVSLDRSISLSARELDRLTPRAARLLIERLQQRLQVVVVDTEEDDDSVACPGCGAMNDADAMYCDQCGSAMTSPASSALGRTLPLGLARALAEIN